MAKNKLKKGITITSIVILVLLALLIILPVCFQKQIVNIALKEANERLNATVALEDFHLTMFRNFPNPTLKIDNLSLTLKNEFEGDTLITAEKAFACVNLLSFFSDQYQINEVTLNNVTANLEVDEYGFANWNILPPDTAAKEPSKFNLNMDKIKIKNTDIHYADYENNMFADIYNLNFTLKGNLSDAATRLKTTFTTDSVDFKMSGIKYLHKAEIAFKGDIDADFNANKYAIADNQLRINALLLELKGWVALPEDNGIDMDIQLNMPQNNFKNILSLIPGIYRKNFNDIKVTGNVNLSAYAKGKLINDSYPAFGATLGVNNASFQYPSLPEKVKNININANVSNPGGSLNNTIVNISKLHFEIINNPFNLTAYIRTPLTDPFVSATLNGKINLSDIKKVYPFDNKTNLNGLLSMDLAVKGMVSYVEKKQYDKFEAKGNMSIKDVTLNNTDMFNQDVEISEANLIFNPAYAQLNSCNAKIGRNDIQLSGKIDNYIPYIFKDGILNGNLALTSRYFNLNDFASSEEEVPANDTTSDELTLIQVPQNFNITATAKIDQLIYERIIMKKANVNCAIKNRKLTISNLSADMFNGNIGVNGYYETPSLVRGKADLNVNIKDISTRELCKSFSMFDRYMPILNKLNSNANVKLTCDADLKETMMPDYSTFNSQGSLVLSKIYVQGLDIVQQITSQLKLDKFYSFYIPNLIVNYTIENGKMLTKPFQFKVDQATVNVESGSVGLDQSLNYTAVITMPTSVMGAQTVATAQQLINQANAVGTNITMGNEVKFAVKIGGTIKSPTVNIGLDKARDIIKETITQKVEESKEKVVNTAKEKVNTALEEAQKQADLLLSNAQKKADELIQLQKAANDSLIAKAQAEADKMVAAATNPIEKLAKQKAADLLIAEAKKTAEKQTAATKAKTDKLIADAKAQGDAAIAKAKR
ncbi:MAG: AsmA family protein [Bacteroidales bacterium]|nr:AsmA family protein [Bacteroidales bacterium]